MIEIRDLFVGCPTRQGEREVGVRRNMRNEAGELISASESVNQRGHLYILAFFEKSHSIFSENQKPKIVSQFLGVL
jgi:hypothetical protein